MQNMHVRWRGKMAMLHYEDEEGNMVDLLTMTVTGWRKDSQAEVVFSGDNVQEKLKNACWAVAELIGELRRRVGTCGGESESES